MNFESWEVEIKLNKQGMVSLLEQHRCVVCLVHVHPCAACKTKRRQRLAMVSHLFSSWLLKQH